MPRIDGPRACTGTDLPEVIALVDDAMHQGTDQSMLTDYPLLCAQKNLDNIRILREDAEMAAVVPFLPHDVVMEDSQFRIGIVSATATAVRHQGPVSRHRFQGFRQTRTISVRSAARRKWRVLSSLSARRMHQPGPRREFTNAPIIGSQLQVADMV